jgi:hypothetical protein
MPITTRLVSFDLIAAIRFRYHGNFSEAYRKESPPVSRSTFMRAMAGMTINEDFAALIEETFGGNTLEIYILKTVVEQLDGVIMTDEKSFKSRKDNYIIFSRSQVLKIIGKS